MTTTIEFCMSNLSGGSEDALNKLKENPNLDVIEYTCLDQCDLCFEGFYAIVGGDLISAENFEDLMNHINQYLNGH